ncbi:MAG TPA: sugar phosphate isomerase/epimerase family protein [Cyclobacteriaceae bacterium]|nr:sugar phosphate isomerase/epimerase family protein [Cyclobacteriaceae bacterium]
MQQLGFVSAIMGDKPIEDVFAFASQEKFKCVEVMCWPSGAANRRYAGVTHINVNELDGPKIEAIKKLTEKYGVFISGLGYYPNPLDPDRSVSEYYIEHIKKVIDAASRLGVAVINTFIGRDPSRTVEDNFERFKETWPPVVQYAELKKIKIGIENCPMIFTHDEWPGGKNLATTPDMWKKMFDFIPSSWFGLNYDPSHMIWQMMDEIQPVYDFREKIFHVHLKDARILRDKLNKCGIMGYPVQFHTPKIPGLGDVRWREFFAALTEIKYRGPVCVEVEDRAFEGSDDLIKQSLIISRNYLKQFLVV